MLLCLLCLLCVLELFEVSLFGNGFMKTDNISKVVCSFQLNNTLNKGIITLDPV